MRKQIKLLTTLFFLLNYVFCDAQITTASLYGIIRGSDQVSSQLNKDYILFDAQVRVINENSGLEYEAKTDDYGRFILLNILPGGPYTVKVAYPGYGEKIIENVFFNLGTKSHLDLKMNESFVEKSEKELIKTLQGSEGITSVSENEFKWMPSSNRNFQDFTRFSPYFNYNSFAGNNFRYNNITLDGAINNDAISFINAIGGSPNSGQLGTAGSGSQTSAYSLDAIKQIDVITNAYDVRLGNFAGASINTVTKTGTNKLHGSVYSYAKDASLAGNKLNRNTYSDLITGINLSGAIVPNKVFFFANAEITRKKLPTFNNIGDEGQAIDIATAAAVKNRLSSRYGIDIGETGETFLETESNKFFARLDWNINKSNKLAIRAILNNGNNDNLERSQRTFQFEGTKYKQFTRGLSFVGELNSYITANLTNNLILGSTSVNDYREQPKNILPFISIASDRIWAGTWREASIFNHTQQTFEFTDNLSWHINKHNITFGTHNEFYNINYAFINSWNGRWDYATVSDFLNDKPSRIRGSYNLNPFKNDPTSNFENAVSPYQWSQLGAYIQDEISLGKFTMTLGVRAEYDFFNKQPGITPEEENTKANNSIRPTFSVETIASHNGSIQPSTRISPRMNFKYDVKGNESVVIRGGSGIFTSRIPLSWMGYAFNLNGNNYGNIDWQPNGTVSVPLVTNPIYLADSLKNNPNAGIKTVNTKEINIIDEDFKLPTFWRSSLALDIKKSGWEFGIEGIFSKTLQDVLFHNLNQRDSTTFFAVGPKQSPYYLGGVLNPEFSSVILMTNTTEGYRYNLSVRLGKEFDKRMLGSKMSWNGKMNIAYSYGRAFDVSNGIRNSYQSNFEVNPAIVPNAPELARSNFELRHHIVSNAYFNLNWNEKQTTGLGIFYSGRSGNPYSLVYGGLNFLRNGSSANLLYIPKDRNEISLVPYTNTDGKIISADEQWTAFEQFITESGVADKRGQYIKRNELTSPFTNILDVRLSHEFKFKNQQSVQLSFDIFNFLNLLNKNAGRVAYVSNANNYTVPVLSGARDAQGSLYRGKSGDTNFTPNMNFVLRNESATIQDDEILSSWKGQIGLRYTF